MEIDLLILISVLFSSFVSGVLGMAGGLILMAIYASLLPIEFAMLLHGMTQIFSNAIRCHLHRKNIKWNVLLPYLIGSIFITIILSYVSFKPQKGIVLILLGLFPFTFYLKKLSSQLDITKKFRSFFAGFFVTMSQIFAGASGSILDIFFLNSPLNKYQVIATKALTQTLGHGFKIYFYLRFFDLKNFDSPLMPITIFFIPIIVFIGTYAGKLILKKLSEDSFRLITHRVILTLGTLLLFKRFICSSLRLRFVTSVTPTADATTIKRRNFKKE